MSVARFMRRAGLSNVRTDAAGNILGQRNATRAGAPDANSRPLVILAHLDTVFPLEQSCTVLQEGSRYTGPGIGDNSRGLAGMLALAALVSDPAIALERPVLFAATTGEEGDGNLRGARHLFASMDTEPCAAVAIDGPGDDRVVHRAVGSRRFRIEFSGPGGHSWGSRGAANPLHAAGRATEMLSRWRPPEPGASLAVTRMGGGVSINAIPREAWMEVDVRGLSTRALEAGERAVKRAADSAVHRENDVRSRWSDPCSVMVRLTGDRPAGELDATSPLVRSAVTATRAVNREPVLVSASTDANVPISLGIPAISIGAGGRGGGAHTPNEWYENAEGWLGLERALAVLLSVAG